MVIEVDMSYFKLLLNLFFGLKAFVFLLLNMYLRLSLYDYVGI